MISDLQEANAVAWFAPEIPPVRIPIVGDRNGEQALVSTARLYMYVTSLPFHDLYYESTSVLYAGLSVRRG